MPKDTKRFINPLLRSSSQENVPVPTPTKPDSTPLPQPVAVEEEKHSEEVQDSLTQQNETPVDVAASIPVSEDVVQSQEASEEATSMKRHSPSSSTTSHSRDEEKALEQQDLYAEAGSSDSSGTSETIPPQSASPVPTTSATSDLTDLNVEDRREEAPVTDNRRNTYQREATSSRRRRHSSSEAEVPKEAVVTEAGPFVESLDQPRSIPHRRHGTQTFEATHERITLWIDRQLKQNFEALAYDRSLSKTKLLNEAIAELLKKYGVR